MNPGFSFLLIEWCKISIVHFLGISNVSVLLHVLTIFQIEWVKWDNNKNRIIIIIR